MLGGRRSAGADRSEAQLPAAHRTRKAVEAVGKRNGPSDFCPGWAVFHQFEITKNSEPSNSAASSSAAHTTEIESHRLSLLWIMNPAPQPAAALLRELASVRRFPDSIFGHGCSTRGTPGDLSTEFFVIPGMAVGTPHPLRGLFETRTSGLPRLVHRPQIAGTLMRAISVDRVSYNDASAKQTQDYCDFNHFNTPIYYGYVDSRS